MFELLSANIGPALLFFCCLPLLPILASGSLRCFIAKSKVSEEKLKVFLQRLRGPFAIFFGDSKSGWGLEFHTKKYIKSTYDQGLRMRFAAILFLLLPGGALVVMSFLDNGNFMTNVSSKIWLVVFIVVIISLWRFGHKLSAQ